MGSRWQIAVLLFAASLCAPHAAGATPSEDPAGGGSGIALSFRGAKEGRDYVVERLYYDSRFDDRRVVYMKKKTEIALAHDDDNVDPRGRVIGRRGPGVIRYKIDGDELWEGGSHRGNAQPYARGAPDYRRHPTVIQYVRPFSIARSYGTKGKTRLPHGKYGHYHLGLADSYGDEWHTLAYWDDDSGWFKGRPVGGVPGLTFDNASDGRVVNLVVAPRTPAITFDAPAGEGFYTTPPKVYYIPKIRPQTTYLTRGAAIRLVNLADRRPVYFSFDRRQWRRFPGQATTVDRLHALAGAGRAGPDRVYRLYFRNGRTGPVKKRLLHLEPASPTKGKEVHPKLFWASAGERRHLIKRLGRPPYRGAYLALKNRSEYTGADLKFGPGRLSHHQIGRAALNNAFVAALEGYDSKGTLYAKRAKQALLASFTVDPLGDENPMAAAYSSPSPDRVYYGFERRVHIVFPAAYDLLAGYTTANGYREGLTPIEEIKVRDNLASEALQLRRRRDAERGRGNWRVGNDLSLGAFAMAMPVYRTPYFGTSDRWQGAPERSALWKYFSSRDGYWKEGHLGQYNQQLFPYIAALMNFRHNFDGGRYKHLEEHAAGVVYNRHPSNGKSLAAANGNSERNDSMLSLINPRFPMAGLYRWHLDTPRHSAIDYRKALFNDDNLVFNLAFFDDRIKAVPPRRHRITANSAVFSSDPRDPGSVFGRLQGQSFDDIEIRWAAQASDFTLDAFGEHLLVRPGRGLTGLPVSPEGYNTLLVDDTSRAIDRGVTIKTKAPLRGLTGPSFSFAGLKIDGRGDGGVYGDKKITLRRTAVFVDRRFFILFDDARSGAGRQRYGLALHGSSGGDSRGLAVDRANQSTVWSRPGGAKLLAQVIGPRVTISRFRGASSITGKVEPYVIAETTSREIRLATVLYPLKPGERPPEIRSKTVRGYTAGEVERGRRLVAFHSQKGRRYLDFGRYRTDARIAAASFQGGRLDDLMIIGGRRFFHNGRAYVRSTTPVDLSVSRRHQTLRLAVRAVKKDQRAVVTVGGLRPGGVYWLQGDKYLRISLADFRGQLALDPVFRGGREARLTIRPIL